MSLTARLPIAILLAVAAFAYGGGVLASPYPTKPSVEVFIDPVDPPGESGNLDPGANRPLKSGDLPWSSLLKGKKATTTAAPTTKAPPLPAGQLRVPQVSSVVAPPPASTPQNSAASVMLMQGMKNALQQGGQNPNLPQSASDVAPTSSSTPQNSPPKVGVLSTPQLEPGVIYQPGREPRNLAEEAKGANVAPSLAATPAASVAPTSPAAAPAPPEPSSLKASPSSELPVPTKKESGFFSRLFGFSGDEADDKAPTKTRTKTKVERILPAPAFTPQKVPEPASATTAPVLPTPAAPEAAARPVVQDPEDTACGSAAREGAKRKPSHDLCAAGVAGPVQGNGPWEWACSNPRGDNQIRCSTEIDRGVSCGPATLRGHHTAPTTDLCTTGTTPFVEGEGPWKWTCWDDHSGAHVDCKALESTDGACGPAHNRSFKTKPKSEALCSTGTSSRVDGQGPWNWTCLGKGGKDVECATRGGNPKPVAETPPTAPSVQGETSVAEIPAHVTPSPASSSTGPLASGLACGTAAEMAAFKAPSTNLCVNGTSSAVVGQNPWTWSCLDDNGHTLDCSTLGAAEGRCGSGANLVNEASPVAGLCASGTSGDIRNLGDRWTWECRGSMGAPTMSCSAPVQNAPKATSTSEAPSDEKIKCKTSEKCLQDAKDQEKRAQSPAPTEKPRAESPRKEPAKSQTPRVKSSGLVTPRLSTDSANVPQDRPATNVRVPATPAPPQQNAQPTTSSDGENKNKPAPGKRLVLDDDLSIITFERGLDSLDEDATDVLIDLAHEMKTHGNARITLTAYADMRGSDPREARRLSLARALNARDYLVSKGVASSRIDVRALGANVSSGIMDRIDVKVN